MWVTYSDQPAYACICPSIQMCASLALFYYSCSCWNGNLLMGYRWSFVDLFLRELWTLDFANNATKWGPFVVLAIIISKFIYCIPFSYWFLSKWSQYIFSLMGNYVTFNRSFYCLYTLCLWPWLLNGSAHGGSSVLYCVLISACNGTKAYIVWHTLQISDMNLIMVYGLVDISC